MINKKTQRVAVFFIRIFSLTVHDQLLHMIDNTISKC